MGDKHCNCCSSELSEKINKVECCIKTIANIATELNVEIDKYEIPEEEGIAVRDLVKRATNEILSEIAKVE